MSSPVILDDTGAQVTWAVRENTSWTDDFKATLTATGAPIDLTSITITAEITATPLTNTALKSFTVTKTNTAAGEFTIGITPADATLSPGTYWWSMQWVDSASREVPLCAGNFVVQEWTL